MEGYPILLTREGVYPIPGLDGGGGTPSQVWTGGVPHSQVMGVPHSQVWTEGYPIPGVDGGGYPRLDGVPPPPIRIQSSIASTCYAAGGMSLAFTQEDFLVKLTSVFVCICVFTFNVSVIKNGTAKIKRKERRHCVCKTDLY